MHKATRLLNVIISDARGKQLPLSLGDDFNGAIGHFDGSLIVNRIGRHGYRCCQLFQVDEGILWKNCLMIRNNRFRCVCCFFLNSHEKQ